LHQSYLTLLHRDVASAAQEAADSQSQNGGGSTSSGWLSSLMGSSGSDSSADGENAEPPLLYALDKMHSNTW